MPARKKKNPRTKIVLFRATPVERYRLEEEAYELGLEFSVYIRKKLGLVEKND